MRGVRVRARRRRRSSPFGLREERDGRAGPAQTPPPTALAILTYLLNLQLPPPRILDRESNMLVGRDGKCCRQRMDDAKRRQ